MNTLNELIAKRANVVSEGIGAIGQAAKPLWNKVSPYVGNFAKRLFSFGDKTETLLPKFMPSTRFTDNAAMLSNFGFGLDPVSSAYWAYRFPKFTLGTGAAIAALDHFAPKAPTMAEAAGTVAQYSPNMARYLRTPGASPETALTNPYLRASLMPRLTDSSTFSHNPFA